MEVIDKRKVLNYCITILIFVLFTVAIWGLSLLMNYFNENSYKNALESFLSTNTESLVKNFSQGTFTIEEDYSTVSIKAFKFAEGKKLTYFFLVPFFTHNGLDLAVVAFDLKDIVYLGTISKEASENISNIAISRCKEKVKNILELDK